MKTVILNDAWAMLPLKPRLHHTHKYQCGHVVIIGGDQGMSGAVRLAAEAALRSGAGLATVVTHPEHVQWINSTCPELMTAEWSNFNDMVSLFEKASVIVLGPGLKDSAWSKQLIQSVLDGLLQHDPEKSILIDGGALRFLRSYCENNQNKLKSKHWILTPHMGEAMALMNVTHKMDRKTENERIEIIESLRDYYGSVIVLKGAGTLIAGEGEDVPIWLCQAGNPGMASAGMGDVLSGVIAGLWAQGLSAMDSAALGVYVHARAADEEAVLVGERGLLAHDLLLPIREWINHYANMHSIAH